ncbi:MAG: hypothetical protein ACLQVD_12595 [Capsulimonadaceae bacterium]
MSEPDRNQAESQSQPDDGIWPPPIPHDQLEPPAKVSIIYVLCQVLAGLIAGVAVTCTMLYLPALIGWIFRPLVGWIFNPLMHFLCPIGSTGIAVYLLYNKRTPFTWAYLTGNIAVLGFILILAAGGCC